MTLATVEIPTRDLEPHPQNAKKHDMDTLRRSVRRFGQYRTIVVQAPRNGRKKHRVLAGHGTWFALVAEGFDSVACNVHDIDDDTALRIVLMDNRAPELGGWDDEALVAMLGSLPDLDDTGYSQRDFDRMQAKLMEDFESGDQGVEETLGQRFGVVVELEDEEEQARVIDAIVDLGFEPRALYS